MASARFRIDPGLAPFLPRRLRAAGIEHTVARAATVKNAVEALGVPHTVALAPVYKAAVQDRLPEQVARTHACLVRCGRCERIYWPGSHHARSWQRLRARSP